MAVERLKQRTSERWGWWWLSENHFREVEMHRRLLMLHQNWIIIVSSAHRPVSSLHPSKIPRRLTLWTRSSSSSSSWYTKRFQCVWFEEGERGAKPVREIKLARTLVRLYTAHVASIPEVKMRWIGRGEEEVEAELLYINLNCLTHTSSHYLII